jgi:hypothetical protein
MYYQKIDGKLIRPLPGYFDGLKRDLENVDEALLSEMQADYMSIPDAEIAEVDEKTHTQFTALQQCLENRRQAYREEADSLYLEAIYDARITKSEPDFTKWDEKHIEIRNRIPKPGK